jgi:hypothetical protein
MTSLVIEIISGTCIILVFLLAHKLFILFWQRYSLISIYILYQNKKTLTTFNVKEIVNQLLMFTFAVRLYCHALLF